jgi:putative transposase
MRPRPPRGGLRCIGRRFDAITGASGRWDVMSIWLPHVGAHSVSWLFVHVVWATRARAPVIVERFDAALERSLRESAASLDVAFHAYGAFDDHAHVLLQIEPETVLSSVVHRLKGASSHALGSNGVRWQAGYWVESVSYAALDRCRTYVLDQRRRHAVGHPDEPWQRPDSATNWSPPSAAGFDASIPAGAPAFMPGDEIVPDDFADTP